MWPPLWSILEDVQWVLEKNMHAAHVGWTVLQIRYGWLAYCVAPVFHFLIGLCLVVTAIIESEVLKLPSVLWIVCFSLHFCQFCFIHFGLLLLGGYMFRTVVSSWWTDSIIRKCPFISTRFCLILSVAT